MESQFALTLDNHSQYDPSLHAYCQTKPAGLWEPSPLVITTQTVLAELGCVAFDEQDIDITAFTNTLTHMLRNQLIDRLLSVHTKHYLVHIRNQTPHLTNLRDLPITKSPMKSSVLFMFSDAYVRVFRNGKVQIPGVVEHIAHSSVYVTLAKVQMFFGLYLRLTETPRIEHLYVVMLNYKATVNAPAKLSVRKIIALVKQHAAHFAAPDFTLSHCAEIRNRPVLLLKYQIQKVVYKFNRNNDLTNAKKKPIKTITLQLMQSGKLLLQGCVRDDSITLAIVRNLVDFLKTHQHAITV